MPLDKDLPIPASALDRLAGLRAELASEARGRARGGLHVEELRLDDTGQGIGRARLHRLRPAPAAVYQPARLGQWRSTPFAEAACPNQLRWAALPFPEGSADFLDGMVTIGGAGELALRLGASIHIYRANRSMTDRYFFDADGELLVAPQQGRLKVRTEFGELCVGPSEFAVIPRGVRFSVDLLDALVRGFVCENYGAPLAPAPSLDPETLKAIGLQAPKAAFEDRRGPVELVAKLDGGFWTTELAASPLDVVAWQGGCFPYKGALAGLGAPGLHKILASPGQAGAAAALEVGVLAGAASEPRADRTAASRYLGQISAAEAPSGLASGGLPAGGGSLSGGLAGFDPVAVSRDGLALLIQTPLQLRPTRFALSTPALQRSPDDRIPLAPGFPAGGVSH
jgi:homogentisate 1,2-dioxygenase